MDNMKTLIDIQNKVEAIKAKLHAQNVLLSEVKSALETANTQLNKNQVGLKIALEKFNTAINPK